MHIVLQPTLTTLRTKAPFLVTGVLCAAGLTGSSFALGGAPSALLNPVGVALATITAAQWVASPIGDQSPLTRPVGVVVWLIVGVIVADQLDRPELTSLAQVLWFAPWWGITVAATSWKYMWSQGTPLVANTIVLVVGAGAVGCFLSIFTLASLSVIT